MLGFFVLMGLCHHMGGASEWPGSDPARSGSTCVALEESNPPHPNRLLRNLFDLSPKYGGEVWVADPLGLLRRKASQQHLAPRLGGEVAEGAKRRTAGEGVGLYSLSVARPEPSRFEFESKHMGTTFRIVLYAADAASAKKAADAAFARVAEIDNCMSDYKQSSELMQLCKRFATEISEPVKVSEDLFFVLSKAEELSKKSDGAFDVTVGPVVQLWRHARRTQELPEPKEFAAARAKVGYQKVKLDPAKKTVQLTTAGMQLDLGGIAKGYAADEALKLLREKFGIKSALVGAYGDITCGDPPPGKESWTVDIVAIAKSQKPRTLNLANASVSTSGDLEQFVVINGVRYSHVLDPKTGLGLTGRRSVTVIAPNGTTADSMTKAVSVLPQDAALKLVEDTPGVAAYIVILDKDEKPVVTASKRFPKFATKE